MIIGMDSIIDRIIIEGVEEEALIEITIIAIIIILTTIINLRIVLPFKTIDLFLFQNQKAHQIKRKINKIMKENSREKTLHKDLSQILHRETKK